MPFFKSIWKEVVFLTGDLRRTKRFPFFTISHHKHLVDYDEILEVLPKIKYGDIGLHRDLGYMSNIFIPGFMKHAWIHTVDGVENARIVEAVSEGVIKRNPIYPLFSDFSIILSPKNVTDEERKGACLKANDIIGEEYDVAFEFDIEKELKFYHEDDLDDAVDDLSEGVKQFKKYDFGFSCTETVSYAWCHKRKQLRIHRQKRRGKKVIIADDFINNAWEIKWMSKSVTLDAAQSFGLPEEGLMMIKEYLAKNT